MQITIQGAGPSKMFPTEIDFDNFGSAEEIMAEAYALSAKYGMVLYLAGVAQEELSDIYTACVDHNSLVATFTNLWTAHELIEKYGDAFVAFIGLGLTSDGPWNWDQQFSESYMQEWDSRAAFAEENFSELNHDVYEGLQACNLEVDWEAHADTLESNEGYYFEDAGLWGKVHVFRDIS